MSTAGSTGTTSQRSWTQNVLIAAIGLTLFAGLNARSGRIEANDGLGWDGRQYAHMVTARVQDGTVATQTRPLLPLLTRIPYSSGHDVIRAFQVMNFLYAAALYFFLCLILDLYEVPPVYKTYFVVTVALCIATAGVFAFYPTQIDLGALAVSSASTYLVLTRSGWIAGPAALVAVATRELNVALAFFGFHRELRQGAGFRCAFLTYTPAVAVLFLIRQWASATNLGDRDRPLLTAVDLLANLELWYDPAFAVFFFYFLLTVLGGVTVLLASNPVWCAGRLVRTPELFTFAAPLVAVSAIGNADIWRYLVFLLPVLAIFFAAYVRDYQPGPALLAGAFVLTLVTQQPFTRMDMTQYFHEWFPYYLYRANEINSEYRLTWAVLLATTVVGAIVLAIIQWRTATVPRSPQPRPAKRGA